MNTKRRAGALIGGALIIVLLAGCGDGDAKRLQSENEALRTEIAALQARNSEADGARTAEIKRQEADASDVARLRGEVTQLRNAVKDVEKLRTENQQLRSENQKLRTSVAATEPAPAPQTPAAGTFPRESWKFAGYSSPENALVSAIYAMQQGYTKEYFNSLTPEEQARMAKAWEGKPQEEIAAKHSSDTAAITGLQVLNQQAISPDEVQMNVHIGGVERDEKISVKRIGNDWKFNGFIREAKP
jgi:regulator of replication initiation timing